MIAGDGYQASNQRRLLFGLGGTDRILELRIRWPSGHEQSFADLPADRELVFVEGSDRPRELRRD
jgi:hypothetical protein